MPKPQHGDKPYETVERYRIAGYDYEIIPQSREEYAVRRKPLDGSESSWLKEPQPRFETLGGARGAILMDLETLE